MSIFEAKEWWSTNISNDEEFDSNSICIENIDNENPPKNKIILSSFKGFLRIFEPHFGNYKSDDLLYEKFYDNPIIQINSGNFIINSPDKQLAILQNKKLIVIQIFNLKGVTSIKTCYEHKLIRNAFNFCLGRIGDKNYDIIFVQSVDGVISIYEQDSLVNNIALNEVIIPGPISFLTRKECFLISNTNYEIECYTYNILATTTSKSDLEKKILHTWSTELGELIREIKIIDNKFSKKQEIVVLTENMIFLLDDNGKLIYQKKFDFDPLAFHAYNIDLNSGYVQNKSINIMYMISSTLDHVLVYRGLDLVWAIKLHDTPVYLSLNDFDINKNLIVSTSKSSLITNNSIPNMKISMKPSNSSSFSDLSSKLPIDDKNKNFLHINGNNNKLNNQIENSKNIKKFMAIDEVLGVNINDSDSFLDNQYNQGGNNNKIFIESILDKETIKIDYKKEKNFDISKFLHENKKLEFNNNQPVFNANNKSNTIIDNKNNLNNLIKLTVKSNDRNNYNNSPKNIKNISTSNNTRNLINVNVSNNIPAEQQNKANILNLNKNNYQQIDFENDIKKKVNNLDNVEFIFNNQNTKIKNLNFQNIFKSKENLMKNQSNEIVTLNFLEISQIELNKNEKENFNLKKNEGKFSLQFFYNKKIQNSEINKNLLNSVVLIQDKLHLSTGDICLNLSNGNVQEIKEISTEIFRSKNKKEKNENNFFLNMNLEKDLFELRINMLEKL